MKTTPRNQVGVEYAVMFFDGPLTPLRPLRATCITEPMSGGRVTYEVHDPDDPLDFPSRHGTHELVILGGWDDEGDWGPNRENRSWAQIADEQMQHVKRQRELAARLTKVGIKRDPEPYLHRRDRTSNWTELSLTLNYDELDLLLRRGGA